MGFQPVRKTPEQLAAQKQKIKKSGLRAIDAGTRYDITGNLRRLARAIEQGEYGSVHHVMVGVSTTGPNTVTTLGLGVMNLADANFTVEMMKANLVGR